MTTSRIGRAPRRGPAALILAGALALTACGGDNDDAASDSAEPADEMTAEESVSGNAGGSDDGFIASDDSGDTAAADRASEGGFDIGVVGRDVIVEMRVVVSSDDIERTVASVMASAATLGGGVASSDVNYGNDAVTGSQGYAVLVVKVPPESVDRLLSGLDDTGTVQSINQSAQDVTEQLVNLDVRIRNARQSVANVREFMDRTENLNELVTLESELTRRQTDLEQHDLTVAVRPREVEPAVEQDFQAAAAAPAFDRRGTGSIGPEIEFEMMRLQIDARPPLLQDTALR